MLSTFNIHVCVNTGQSDRTIYDKCKGPFIVFFAVLTQLECMRYIFASHNPSVVCLS